LIKKNNSITTTKLLFVFNAHIKLSSFTPILMKKKRTREGIDSCVTQIYNKTYSFGIWHIFINSYIWKQYKVMAHVQHDFNCKFPITWVCVLNVKTACRLWYDSVKTVILSQMPLGSWFVKKPLNNKKPLPSPHLISLHLFWGTCSSKIYSILSNHPANDDIKETVSRDFWPLVFWLMKKPEFKNLVRLSL
jgi:hypothetical protein